MEIQTRKKATTITITIGGDLTIYAVNDFKKRFIEEIADFNKIEIDLSQVTRLDTAGFQLLLLARRAAEMDRKMIDFLNPSPEVLRLFSIYNEKIDNWSAYGRREEA
jgi:anti-anti-sigma factor